MAEDRRALVGKGLAEPAWKKGGAGFPLPAPAYVRFSNDSIFLWRRFRQKSSSENTCLQAY
jgi:hypothetical protein